MKATALISSIALASIALLPADLSAVVTVLYEPFDVYPGSGADPGWQTGWVSTGGTASLANTTPLNGQGSYLNVNGTGTNNTGIRRQIDTTQIDTTLPYSLSWDYRMNNSGTSFITSTDNPNNRIHFGASSTDVGGTNNSWTWLVGVVGSPPTANAGKNFYFYDNKNPGTIGDFFDLDGTSNLVNTGIAFQDGVTYSFKVNVDPLSKTYSAAMTSSLGQSFAASGLDFRNPTNGLQTPYLHFGYTAIAAGTRNFSIDTILLVAPEPGRASFFVLAGLLLLAHRRRP